jgi:hypothetical protein
MSNGFSKNQFLEKQLFLSNFVQGFYAFDLPIVVLTINVQSGWNKKLISLKFEAGYLMVKKRFICFIMSRKDLKSIIQG